MDPLEESNKRFQRSVQVRVKHKFTETTKIKAVPNLPYDGKENDSMSAALARLGDNPIVRKAADESVFWRSCRLLLDELSSLFSACNIVLIDCVVDGTNATAQGAAKIDAIIADDFIFVYSEQ